MKRLLQTLIFFLAIGVLSPIHATTILIYHKIGDNRTPSTNVSVTKFRQQMEYLKTHNYTVLPLSQLVNMIRERKPLPKKSVVITFDDGYRSVYENAFGIIKEFGYPITVFIPTEAIEKHYPDYLTFKQIEAMRRYGADFECHSYAHHHMAFIPKGFSQKQYRNWIKKDLEKSIAFFKKHFGYKPKFFAIPYGEYNKTVIDVAKSLGFEAILTQDPGAVSIYTPLYLLPREAILGKNWSTMKHFIQILREEYLPITKRVPDYGIQKTTPLTIGANLLFPDNYDRCGVYVSELGYHKARREGSFVFIRNTKKLKRPKDRIAITCVDKKKKRIAVNYWLIINQPNW